MKCIGVRVDANEKIGMGHLMRCRTIALELAECGCRVVFFTAEKACEGLLKQWEFAVHLLEKPPFSMEEIPSLTFLLEAEKVELLLVDSYRVTGEYLKKISGNLPVYYMDDLGEEDFPVQGIINYNLYAKELPYDRLYEDMKEPPKFLLGSMYAPVRREFVKVHDRAQSRAQGIVHDRAQSRAQGIVHDKVSDIVQDKSFDEKESDEIKHILITMGGSDPMEITLALANRICEKWGNSKEFVLDLVCGPMCAGRNRIENFVKAYSGMLGAGKARIRLHTNVQDMWNLMACSDFALCAAGSTMYELCTVGVPTVTCYYVDNQEKAALAFGEKTFMKNAGDYRKDKDAVIDGMIKQLECLWEKDDLRQTTIESMHNLVDGKGARRIAEALIEACR